MTAAVCPECGGARLDPHPEVDPLRFRHDQRCRILALEDSIKAADAEEVPAGWEPRRSRQHERILLAAVAGVDPNRVGRCIVTRVSAGVIRRSFLDDTGAPITLDPEPTEETA